MSDASFVLDIAAQTTGVEQTTAQLDALSGKLIAAGVSAGTMHDAVAAASNALTAAKVAASAASAALAEGNTKYLELEQAANQAAKAQEKAAKSGVVPPGVAAAAASASAALSAHEAELAKLEQASKTAAADEDKLAAALGSVKKLVAGTAPAMKDAATAASVQARETGVLRRAFSELGGPLGHIGRSVEGPIQAFQKLSGVMGSGQAAAIVAAAGAATVAAAIAVVTIAAIAATIAIAAWAVGLADTSRSAGLTAQAVEIMNPKLEALHSTIAALGTQTGLSTATLDGIAKSLTAAKVSATDLPEALKAAALAEKALGTGGAQQFIDQLATSKKSVAALAAETQSKLGGVVAKQMLSLSDQTATFHSNISALFGGLDIDPVLSGLHRLVALFDENTAAGAAIKFLFSSIFQPLINQADNAATVIEAFALGFLIGLMNVYIAVKPLLAAVEKLFGFKDASLTNTLALVTKAGEYIAPVFVVLAVVFGVVVAAVLAVVGVLAVMGAAFVAPIYAVIALGAAIEAGIAVAAVAIANFVAGLDIVTPIRNAWTAVTTFFAGIDLSSVGTSIIEGLASGITNAAGAVLSAIGGVVTGAISSAHKLLDINSPSKVFAAIGGSVGEGFAGGIDDSAPDAQSSLENMVNPSRAAGAAASSAGGAGASSGGGAGRGVSVVFEAGAIVLNGVKDAEQGFAQFTEMFTRTLEGMALQAEGRAPA